MVLLSVYYPLFCVPVVTPDTLGVMTGLTSHLVILKVSRGGEGPKSEITRNSTDSVVKVGPIYVVSSETLRLFVLSRISFPNNINSLPVSLSNDGRPRR